jgi:hypothetical protein
LPATIERLERPEWQTRFRSQTLHPGMASGKGSVLDAPPLPPGNLPQEIDRSYKVDGTATVFGRVRFSPSTGQKCFT